VLACPMRHVPLRLGSCNLDVGPILSCGCSSWPLGSLPTSSRAEAPTHTHACAWTCKRPSEHRHATPSAFIPWTRTGRHTRTETLSHRHEPRRKPIDPSTLARRRTCSEPMTPPRRCGSTVEGLDFASDMADVSSDVDALVRLAFSSDEPVQVWREEADRVVERLREEAGALRDEACLDVAEHFETLATREAEGTCELEAEVEDLPETLRGLPPGWIQEMKQLVREKWHVETQLRECRDLEASEAILWELRRRKEAMETHQEKQTWEQKARLVLEQWKQLQATESKRTWEAHATELQDMKQSASEGIQSIHQHIQTHLQHTMVLHTTQEPTASESSGETKEAWLSVTTDGLDEILGAARALERQDEIVQQCIDRLEAEFVLVAFPKSKALRVNMWTETGSDNQLHWAVEDAGPGTKAENMAECIEQSVKFLAQYMFLGDGFWCERFVQAYWDRITTFLVDNDYMAIPTSDHEELKDLHDFMRRIDVLSQTLSSKFGCPCDPNEVLARGVQNSKSYYNEMLLEMLDQVRQAYMMEEWTVEYIAADVEAVTLSSCPFEDLEVYFQEDGMKPPIIERGGYAVTPGGLAAVKCIANVMQETISAANLGFRIEVVRFLFESIGNIVLLVLELPRGRHGNLLSESSRLCLLYGNDCEHVARSLIPWAYKARWDVKEDTCRTMHAALIDHVQQLYTASERTSNDHLEGRVAEVMAALRSIGSFRSFTQTKKDALLRGLSTVVDCLAKLQSAWNGMLPVHTYVEMIGRLLKCIGSYLFQETLRNGDLSIDDCNALHSSLLEFLEAVEERTVASRRSKEGPRSVLRDFQRLRRFAGSEWTRLEALTDLLGDKLRDIVDKWEMGELQDQGWNVEQLQKFVQMVFSETSRREEALLRIQERAHSEP